MYSTHASLPVSLESNWIPSVSRKITSPCFQNGIKILKSYVVLVEELSLCLKRSPTVMIVITLSDITIVTVKLPQCNNC